MSPRLTESWHGNGPAQGQLCRRQTQDLMKAGSLRVHGNRQHQPEGLQCSQLAAAAPFFFLMSALFEQSH
jgi:hypothetical protein